MAKSPEDYKKELIGLVEPYMAELSRLIKASNVSDEKKIVETNSSIERTSISSVEEVRLFIRRLYDLQSVLMLVYNALDPDKKRLENLIEYVDYFNKINVISVPLKNAKVLTLLDNLQNLTEEDINQDWIRAFNEEKIDIPVTIRNLLDHLISHKLQEVVSKFDFLHSPSLREYKSDDYLISAKRDHSKVVLSDVKFRPNITDVRSIVLRAIESWQNYQPPYEFADKYLLVFIFTNEQDHQLNKFAGQFSKHLAEIDESLIRRIQCVALSTFKLDNLQDKIESCFNIINGYEINFNYNDSPLSHGWKAPQDISHLESIFTHLEDDQQGNVLKIKFPTFKYSIKNQLVLGPKWRLSTVSFVFKPGEDCELCVEISIKDSNKEFWFNIKNGEGEPEVSHENGKFEWFVFSPHMKIGDWNLVKINVFKEFERTFGKEGLILNKIEGVRLRGAMTIAKIFFE